MGWGGASSPGGGADSSPDAPGGGLGSGAFGGDGPSVSGQSKSSQDTSTIEGFRAALAKALGQVTQEQKDKAVEAQKNLAKNQEALTKKTGISVAKTTQQISKEQEIQNLIDNFDPKAKLGHNPHLKSLVPGTYEANVSLDLDQQLDLGLITKFQYDATKAMINQNMPIGKNVDLGIKNMPTINPDVEDVDKEKRGAFRNISYGSFPSAVVDNGLLGAAIDDPQGTQEGLDAEQAAMEDAANNRAIAAAVEARDKAIRDAADLGELDSGMMGIDNDDDNDRGLLGAATNTENTDPQENQEAIDAIGRSQRYAQEQFRGLENKAMGSTVENNVDRQAFENAMKESVQAYRDISGELGHPDFGFSGTAVEGAAPSGLESNVGGPSLGDPGQSIGDRNLANRSRRAALALESFNNLEQTVKRDPNLTERERARKLAAIQDTKRTTEYGTLVGYAFPGQTIAGVKTSTLATALASLLGLGMPMGIMSVLDKTLGKKGFGQVERDALTSIARDIEESGGSPATAGYGGGSDETKRKFYEYIMQVEPWAKGLSDRQINYYLENEEELEWVRNLYKDMTNA